MIVKKAKKEVSTTKDPSRKKDKGMIKIIATI